MSLDTANYTAMMGRDEEWTHEQLSNLLRQLVIPTVEACSGRIVKKTGDGALIEFRSVIDALRCSVIVQCAMRERSTVTDSSAQIAFRIGISLGDVIVEPDDIYGDAVNLAVRLEGISPLGGIVVSQSVADHLRGHPSLDLEDFGTHALKNIGNEVRVFQVRLPDSFEKPPVTAGLRAIATFRDRPAIAVLPFENIGGDKSDDYFCDGLTEDIITELGSWRSFPVISRNSTFGYRGAVIALPLLGRELGARYILTGNARRNASRVRIFAELLAVDTATHVFAERFETGLEDLFAVQADISRRIVGALEPELLRQETERAVAAPHSFGAYDLFLRGLWHHNRYTAEDNLKAQKFFGQALELDPNYAQAAAALAVSMVHRQLHGWAKTNEDSIGKALLSAQYAIAIDPILPQAMYAMGLCHMHSREIRLAMHELKEVTRLHPSHAVAHANLGNVLNYVNEPVQALESIRTARGLSPNDPRRFIWSPAESGAYYLQQRYIEAIEAGQAGHSVKPDFVAPLRYVAAAMGQLGQLERAASILPLLEAMDGGLVGTETYLSRYYVDKNALEIILEGLRKAGLK